MKLSNEDGNLGWSKKLGFALYQNYFYLQKIARRNSLSSSQSEQRQSEVACFNIVTTNISAKSPEIYFNKPVVMQMKFPKERNWEKLPYLKSQYQIKSLLEVRERKNSEIEQLKASNTLKSFKFMEKN